jgi:hypothetical protein
MVDTPMKVGSLNLKFEVRKAEVGSLKYGRPKFEVQT